ncbi:MAG: hypothetical protein QXG77_07075 [Nitrososphaerota archaeon]
MLTVGVKLPEYDRLGIIINQSIPLALFVIYVLYIVTATKKISLKELSLTLMLAFSYYGVLLLKTAPDLYIVNIGLRASQYILLLYIVRVMNSIERARIQHDTRKGRLFFFMLIMSISLSIVTYPSLLPPSLKGLEPSYYIPYTTAKVINPLLPYYAPEICVLAEAPGIPVNDLFNGFIYGFIPERIDLVVSRIYPRMRSSNELRCDIIFFTDYTKELQWTGKIFDTKIFSLYAP